MYTKLKKKKKKGGRGEKEKVKFEDPFFKCSIVQVTHIFYEFC